MKSCSGPELPAACGTGAARRLWDRSCPPPVADSGQRSVGNRKERLRDYASSPDNGSPLRNVPFFLIGMLNTARSDEGVKGMSPLVGSQG